VVPTRRVDEDPGGGRRHGLSWSHRRRLITTDRSIGVSSSGGCGVAGVWDEEETIRQRRGGESASCPFWESFSTPPLMGFRLVLGLG
jgi:hypothetical protein